MQSIEEKAFTNLNDIRLKGMFTKNINTGKIIDTWEFKTTSGELLGINVRKSIEIELHTVFEIVASLSIFYKTTKGGNTFNHNDIKLLSLHKAENKSEEME